MAAAVGGATSLRIGRCALAGDEPKPGFVGPDVCKRCHVKQFRSWQKTGMARTLDDLKPGGALEKKRACGLDPAKDYSGDPACLACHATGYGRETGYPAPPAAGVPPTEAETARARRTAGVVCEACHGPGSLYTTLMRDHQDFALSEMRRLGATSPPTAAECAPCHRPGCPTMKPDYAFDFEKAKTSSQVHDHVPLKHPH